MHYSEFLEWDVMMLTLRKIRNDRIAAELDTQAVEFDQALARAEWREKRRTVAV